MLIWSIALAAAAAGPNDVADLSWLSGYWLSCQSGTEVSETWGAPRGNKLLGSGMTVSADGKTEFEVMEISPGRNGTLTFQAQPAKQRPASFALKAAGEREAVFENLAHDFPQRVIYRREGDTLFARIEGKRGGRREGVEWQYAAAPANSSCPPAPAAAPPAPHGNGQEAAPAASSEAPPPDASPAERAPVDPPPAPEMQSSPPPVESAPERPPDGR